MQIRVEEEKSWSTYFGACLWDRCMTRWPLSFYLHERFLVFCAVCVYKSPCRATCFTLSFLEHFFFGTNMKRLNSLLSVFCFTVLCTATHKHLKPTYPTVSLPVSPHRCRLWK